MLYSLEETEKITGLNRRKIQEYEKHGLSRKPEPEKKKSHRLMYDKSHINELYRLRFYHELDYKIPQIKKDRLTEISATERNALLTEHIKELENKIKSLQKLVAIGKIMCEMGIEPSNLICSDTIIPYDDLMKLLDVNQLSDSSQDEDEIDKWLENNIEQEKIDRFSKALSRLKQLYSVEMEIDNDLVQSQIIEIFDSLSIMFNNSPFIFMSTFSIFIPDSANGEEIDSDNGEGFTEFLYSALQHFYLQRKDNSGDKVITEAFGKITQMYLNGAPIDSDEIMDQVGIAYDFIAKIGYLKTSDIINTLKSYNRVLFCDYVLEQLELDDNQKIIFRVSYIVVLYAIDCYVRNNISNDFSGG